MNNRLCKICNQKGVPFKFYKSLSGFMCTECKDEQMSLNLNANTFNIKKLIERLESMEKNIEDKKYELVIDIEPLSNQLGITKQRCAELIADEFMKIIFTIPE